MEAGTTTGDKLEEVTKAPAEVMDIARNPTTDLISPLHQTAKDITAASRQIIKTNQACHICRFCK